MGHVEFMTREQTSDFVMNDRDSYIKGMTPYDLAARSCKTRSEYMEKYSKGSLNFSPAQKQLVANAVVEVDSTLRKLGQFSATIDLRTIATMSWVFALMPKGYENSWPHTRANVIFLTPDFFSSEYINICETLAHEKVHVFQRAWPEACSIYYASKGFSRIAKRSQVALVRSNPDLDAFIYQRLDVPCYVEYKSHRPKSMDDVVAHGPTEHPNEDMAYGVGALVSTAMKKMSR